MLKLHKLCATCQAIKGNTVLLNRIYNSAFYMKKGESLTQIWKDNTDLFSYESLKNHVHKHQFMNEEDFSQRHLRKIAKNAEKTIIRRTIESKQVWDEVINQGMNKLETGELDMKTADLLKAAKDKSDFELKVKDQELAMMEMVWHFTSGENNKEESEPYDRRVIEGQAVTNFDPAEEPSASLGAGQDGPGNIHYPPAWDAVAPGPNPLPS